MRIKFLSIIVSFLIVSFSMSSCLGEDDPIEYSSNALVQAFELDKVLGVNYTFTIDQLAGKIYNQDSLPVGSDTIIDRILITKLTVAGGVTIRNSANTEDSLFSITDSVNLVGTMATLPDGTPGKPFVFTVWAPDLKYKKNYSLEVRVHQQQPDSLNWGRNVFATNFAPEITGKQKSFIYNDQVFVYAPNSLVYQTSLTNGKTWSAVQANGLPNTELTSVAIFKGAVFATVAGSSKVYKSSNGFDWQVSGSADNVKTLLAPLTNVLTAIKSDDANTERFCTTTDGISWTLGDEVPPSFPRNNISATVYKNIIGIENAVVVGNVVNPTANDTATVAWGYMEGQEWAGLITNTSYTCPKVEDPSIMHYGGVFYIFGKDFKTFYTSKAGIVWNKVNNKFMFPKGIRGQQSDYSMVVDKDNYIWLMRSNPNEVWKGRLNRLGFKRQ